jgi:hypothetical protein
VAVAAQELAEQLEDDRLVVDDEDARVRDQDLLHRLRRLLDDRRELSGSRTIGSSTRKCDPSPVRLDAVSVPPCSRTIP